MPLCYGGKSLSKADDIRYFAENIAQWRVDGLTWAEIAAKLGEEDIRVGTDEIRSYWPRLSDGRSPAEYLLYWRGSQRDAELRESRKRAEAAEAEIEALRQQVRDWERQMQSLLHQDPQNAALRAECDGLRSHIENLQQQIDELTERAAAWQREAMEAHARTEAEKAEVNRLQEQLVEAEARTAKVVSENEVYGDIRYFMGKGEAQARLDEMDKTLNGWVRFGEALCQAYQAGNKAEITQLLDRAVAWAASRGKP